MRVAVVAGLVLVALAGGAVAQVPFQHIATQYSTVIAMNDIMNNYTLAYTEYYDGPRNIVRWEGRSMSSSTVDLLDLNTYMLYRWSASDATDCAKANVSSAMDMQRGVSSFAPSRDFFEQIETSFPMTYIGETSEVRNIPADKWGLSQVYNTSMFVGSINVAAYFALEGLAAHSDAIGVPIRFEVALNFASLAQHIYIDWTLFVQKAQKSTLFDIPAYCRTTTVSIPEDEWEAQPAASSPIDPQPSTMTAPSLPHQFSIVLEAKLTTNSQSVTALRWWRDLTVERLDLLDSDDNEITLIYDYSKNWVYNYSYATSTCTTKGITAATASPLYARAGALIPLFSDDSFFGATAKYTGRTAARGVSADTFVQRQSVTNKYTAVTYTFDMQVLWFPNGWQFPGRETNGDMRIPMRVINNGSTTAPASAAGVSYYDVWDFFEFINVQPAASIFDSTAFSCPTSIELSTTSSSSSSAGTVVGIIIGVVAAILIAYFGYRYWRNRKGNFHSDIQGMNKSTEVEIRP